jgi:uncharacterized protein RhaS with RHS repeats
MDQLCDEVGRDPSSLRRSANLYDAEARAAGGRIRYYDDLDLFERLVANLADAGYQEIGLYHPTDESQMAAFEHIAQEIIPRLKDQH